MRRGEERHRFLLEEKGWRSRRLRGGIDLSIVLWERKVDGYEIEGEKGRFYKERVEEGRL